MNTLGVCPVNLGWAQIANDYRAVIRKYKEPIVQNCLLCNGAYWPPRLRCTCGSADMHWASAGSSGKIVSTVGVDLTPDQAATHWVPRKLAHRLPYTTVIVELSEWPGLRIAALADGLSLTHAPHGSTVTLSADFTDDLVTLIAQASET